MNNAEVVRIFAEVADLMEIKGEDGFRVNAYRKVARSVDDLATDINALAARDALSELPGVGKGMAEKLTELLTTGKLQFREELTHEVPDSVLSLLRIPGLGPKKAALLWSNVGIASLADLKAAIEAGKLDGLKGFGAKSIDQIRQGLAFVETTAGRTRLGAAWEVMDILRQAVLGFAGVERVEPAGSLRRGCETVGDLDLLCVAADGEDIVKQFTELPGVDRVLAAGGTKGSILVDRGGGKTIQADLRVVPAESFGAAWQYFTGSKQHNVRLREMAVKRGWTLNEYSLSEGDRVIASRTEGDIYAAFGLPWFPPEMREDRGEFDLKHVPPDLLTLEHIRGDLHMHTTASDGRNSIEEMVATAKDCGYAYVCITDHSQSSVIANGLKPERLLQHVQQIRAVAQKSKGITVWAGAEVDILSEGRLDYSDEILAQLDFVIASVHVGMSHDIAVNTQRTLAAIRNPYVNLVAHPTGRLINKREAMPLDIETVIKEAARTGTALEINASNYRLDLKDQHARLARENGAMISINTDAHSTDQLDQMRFGVMTARRAWLCRGDVLNTQAAAEITRFVQKKRAHSTKR